MENFVNHYSTTLHDPITQNQFLPVFVWLITYTAWGQNCSVVWWSTGFTMKHTAGVWVLRDCPGWHLLGWKETHCRGGKRTEPCIVLYISSSHRDLLSWRRNN